MRILHIVSYFQPSLGYQETFLARSQIQEGHTVLVLTSDRYAPILYKGGASARILGNRTKGVGDFIEEGINVRRMPIAFEFLSNVWLIGLENNVEEFVPDAIHVHAISPFTTIRIARMRRKLTRTRIVLDNHMAYNALRGKWVIPFYFLFKTLFRKAILDSADSFVAISDDAKVFMYELYGIPLDRIDVIPLGCDTRRFVRDEKLRRDLRRHYGVGDGQVVFCYAGKVIREKGVKTLIDASLELMRKRSDIFVVCIGAKDERYFREIMEEITLSNCQKRFVFFDPVPNEQLPRYYSMADVGVWPKQSSIAMIEAMSMGLPIIISNDSGVLERTDEGKSGLCYRADDFLDLSRKMEIILDEKRREQMGLAARRVAERSDWDRISELFQIRYRSRFNRDYSERSN